MKLLIILLAFVNFATCLSNVYQRGKVGIIHGTEAKPHSKPYQVRLEAKYLVFSQYCSGSLVTRRDIITTARCVAGTDVVEVSAGVHDITKSEYTKILVTTHDIRIHDNYDYDYNNNVAIVKLPEEIIFNEYIASIPINLNVNLRGQTVQISGWGGESFQQLESPVLREASAKFVNDSVCIAHEFEMPEVDLCLSGINGATICYGDAGGPVVLDGDLVAILSPKDYECGRWRSFSAVNLAKFSSWIKKNVESEAKLK